MIEEMNDRVDQIISIENHIHETQKKVPEASGQFSGVLCEIALAAKIVSREVRRAGLADILGVTGNVNVQGEVVKKLDVFAQTVFVEILKRGGRVHAIVSEESEEIIKIPGFMPHGHYLITIDPLDGSSNTDANIPVGTIFGIYRRTPGELAEDDDLFHRPGREQVGAGYVIYGSSTVLVYATRLGGVHGFTLDPSLGEFILSHPDIRTPDRGSILSVNEGYRPWWKENTRNYIDFLKSEGEDRPYLCRYVGSLVADFHRDLLYGGIFLYPENGKDADQPHGKLRLLYEAAPLAFVAEEAGGKASTGDTCILDIVPDNIHQRVPLIIGSRLDVEDYEAYYHGER
ncbi:class 1 fructose-bisphosphatase [Gemmatimonadota bacterium]